MNSASLTHIPQQIMSMPMFHSAQITDASS